MRREVNVLIGSVVGRILDHPSLGGAGVVAAKTAVVYVFLVAGLRLFGKRELGQMNLYDLVLIIILGNSVQNAMINNDTTLGGGIVAAIVLLVLNRLFNTLVLRSKRVERVMVGEPVLIVHDGHALAGRMASEGITREQLDAALREHGIDDVSQVHQAVMEVDGTISVVPAGATVMRTRRHYRGLRLP
jgi:uncharacterized membrane protein YcaP (DUF421 family)